MVEDSGPQGMTMHELIAARLVSGRASMGIIAELHNLLVDRVTNIFMILDEIACLEGAPSVRSSRTKRAAEFRGRWLKGLWHKHHMHSSMTALQRNIENQWRKNPERFVLADNLTPEQLWLEAGKISHRVVLQGYQERSDAGEITGEWIVYARKDRINYYLTLGSHTEDDEIIWHRCLACASEFPELLVLKEQR